MKRFVAVFLPALLLLPACAAEKPGVTVVEERGGAGGDVGARADGETLVSVHRREQQPPAPAPAEPTPVVLVELPPAQPVPGQPWTDPTTGMAFVWVPAGCFQMGSPVSEPGRTVDEAPRHEVCVDGFWLGKTEVTNAQYRRYRPGHRIGQYHGNSFDGDSQPVARVNWQNAQEYIRWVSGKTGRPFRLPTEAEWEYAARGGSTTARSWGREKVDACRYANVHDRTSKRVNTNYTWESHDCDDGYPVTAPVGSFQPNGFGLYDMLGNVWEWCSDWYGDTYYRESTRNNPAGPASGMYRVFRGGSWEIEPRGVRSAHRGGDVPTHRATTIGFRLVLPGAQQ